MRRTAKNDLGLSCTLAVRKARLERVGKVPGESSLGLPPPPNMWPRNTYSLKEDPPCALKALGHRKGFCY
ncbi:MAG: hypothetical protein EBQ85_08360 [Proteobacteria bacterium]|nr:hypothetical protein [Pseudomonadota bacterium]